MGGRGFRLDGTSPLARSDWLAVGEVAGHASGARILSAAPLDEAQVRDLFGDRIETRHEALFDLATGSVTPLRSQRLGAIRLKSGPDPKPDQQAIEQALVGAVREHGLQLLPWQESASQLRARAAFAASLDGAMPLLDDEVLLSRLEEWLPQLIAGRRSLRDLADGVLRSGLEQLLGYDAARQVAHLAPAEFVSPAGSRHPIDYTAPGGPVVEVRAQALYGLTQHPTVGAGRVPLTLAITSPAGRPIQTTKDLPGFWSGSWREVAREMRGRYPRHPWPDDPATASPTLKSKRAS